MNRTLTLHSSAGNSLLTLLDFHPLKFLKHSLLFSNVIHPQIHLPAPSKHFAFFFQHTFFQSLPKQPSQRLLATSLLASFPNKPSPPVQVFHFPSTFFLQRFSCPSSFSAFTSAFLNLLTTLFHPSHTQRSVTRSPTFCRLSIHILRILPLLLKLVIQFSSILLIRFASKHILKL